MAKKKKTMAVEVERKVLSNGIILVKYDDGSYALITPIPTEDAETLFGAESEEEEDDEEDDDDSEDDDDDEVSPESLAEMSFEDLEDLCDDKELETDPDEFDEDDVEKLRKAVAKELGIKLPTTKAASKKSKK